MKKEVKEPIKIGRNILKITVDETEYALWTPDHTLLGRGSCSSEEEAMKIAKNLISSEEKEIFNSRKDGVPSTEEFVKALSSIDVNDKQWTMLKAHFHSPKRKMTSSELAKEAPFKNFKGANGSYGRLAKKIADFLHFTPPGKYSDGRPLWITTLTHENSDSFENDTGHYQHILRDEVAEALKIIGAS